MQPKIDILDSEDLGVGRRGGSEDEDDEATPAQEVSNYNILQPYVP